MSMIEVLLFRTATGCSLLRREIFTSTGINLATGLMLEKLQAHAELLTLAPRSKGPVPASNEVSC